MPTYIYTASSIDKGVISGKEVAKDEKELARSLHEQGYVVTSIHQDEKKKAFDWQDIGGGLFGVSLGEKLVFMRNLKVMIGAGIPLPRALEVLKEQSQNKQLKKKNR